MFRFTRPQALVIAACAICMLIGRWTFALNLTLPVIAKDFGVPPTDPPNPQRLAR